VKKIILFVVISLCTSTWTTAQRGWEIGGWVGVSHYFGDLNTTASLKHPGLAGGGIARFNFNERLCLKMSANYGYISADDKNSRNPFELRRNLNFRTNIFEGVGQFEFNFMPYNYFDKAQWFSPYLFGGFGVFNFNPQGKVNNTWYDLRPLGTEGQFPGDEYYTSQMAFVYGGGFKIAVSEVWSINFELSLRKLFTDYLDDVSKTYPNMNDVRKQHGAIAVSLSDPSIVAENQPKVGQFGRQRGDSRTNDMYTFFGVSLLYYFGDLRCPPVGNR
jgi:opacity protein-like surface antigen